MSWIDTLVALRDRLACYFLFQADRLRRQHRVRFATVRCSAFPEPGTVAERSIYITELRHLRKWASFRCPGGCGKIIRLQLTGTSSPRWKIQTDWLGRATLNPSVRQLTACGCHFWVRKGYVDWCLDTPHSILSAYHASALFSEFSSKSIFSQIKRGVIMPYRFLLPLLSTGGAVVILFFLYHWLSPGRYEAAPWLPQAVVTLLGLVGASWFVHRRLELLEEGNCQRKKAADDQLTATEKGNLNDAIKEADAMMSKQSTSSIIAGQRWLHHLAEDERLDAGLIRSLLCAHIVSSDPALASHGLDTDGVHVSDEAKRQTRQMALEMLFASPGKERYSQCRDTPELASCTWRDHDFTNLHVENVNFRKGDFTNARISGAFFDESDLRETQWNGDFGGSARTFMRGVKMYGVTASSCTFENIDFSKADMSNNGLATRFIRCTFKYCDFKDAKWSGTEFENPNFDRCTGINFDLCRDAKLRGEPWGLHKSLVEKLRSKGVAGY